MPSWSFSPEHHVGLHDNIPVSCPTTSLTALRSKPCDRTQISSHSCLFPTLRVLVYSECVDIPFSLQRETPSSPVSWLHLRVLVLGGIPS